ncbi:MAG: enoyl-CoA hydratase/isomerase family protein [Thermoleophilia bacterium]
MDYENITLMLEGPVGVLTINREKQLNSLNAATIQDVRSALDTVKSRREVRALVITSAGQKAFAAGADIGEIKGLGLRDGPDFMAAAHSMNREIENLGIPTIAAVNGLALGGGCELAMACTLRVASSTAVFGLPELGLGVIPGWGGTQRMPRLIGRHWAIWHMLTGETIKADRALELGLVHKVVDAAEVVLESVRIGERIATKAPLAVRAALTAVNHGADEGLESGLALETALMGALLASQDKQEGIAAFLEKRKPEYRGA